MVDGLFYAEKLKLYATYFFYFLLLRLICFFYMPTFLQLVFFH